MEGLISSSLSHVARGTKSDDVEGTMPETVSDNVDDSLEFSFAM
jgi:hypothetical protein